MQGNIIEDVVSSASGMQQKMQFDPIHNQAGHPAYGLQLPQPLKQTQSLSTSYVAPSNTMQGFHFNEQTNNIGMNAYQSSAIRGRVASPHIYQWDAAPMMQKDQDFRTVSGMQASKQQEVNWSKSLDPYQTLRDAISNVYKDAQMLKVQQASNLSIYMCPVENMTAGRFKYIVAIVPNHEYVPLGSYHSLRSLPWVCFQSRQTDNPAKVFGQFRPAAIHYAIPRDNNNPLFDRIDMKLEDKSKFIYLPESLPCKVELLKEKETDVASQKSNIMSALEAFNTLVTLTEQQF